MTQAGPTSTRARSVTEVTDHAALAAAAFLLSSALLIGLSVAVPGYIRDGWVVPFALSGVPCVVGGVLLLLRRRLEGPGVAAVVLYGDAAILLSAFASEDRVGTTAGALLSLPTLFTATFLPSRWLPVQSLCAAACAAVIVLLVPAPPLVHLIRTSVLVVGCVCPAVIVALLRRHLDRAVLTDPLTGLLNRRGLVARLPGQLARARRSGLPVAVLLVDLDHFKRVNDEFGHAVGDEVLRAVAEVVTRCAGPEALAVRFGGEELAVVLAARPDDVLELAGRTVAEVRQHAARWGATVSIGCAWGRPVGSVQDVLEDLLHQADDRMYRAKRNGRDRVEGPPVATGRGG